MILLIALVASFGVGVLVDRWSVVGVIVVAWAGYYAGLAAGWWGNGLGELWALAMLVLIVGSAASACVGVALRRIGRRNARTTDPGRNASE